MLNIEKIIRALQERKVEFIIIGGCAATVHGATLVTQDLDLCISFTEQNVLKIIDALKHFSPRHRQNRMPMEKDAKLLASYKNLYLLTDICSIDLLGEMPGLGKYNMLLDHSIEIELFGSVCRVLDIDTLIKSKSKMDRPKDKETVIQLKAIKEKM